MSELTVGQLRGLPVNNNVITVPTGHTLYAPGHVIQVASTTLLTSSSTTSSSFVDISGFSISITPKSTSSRILVLVTLAAHSLAGANKFQLVRNSTDLMVGASGATVGTWTGVLAQNGDSNPDFLSFNFFDSPASTSSNTYKVQFATSSGTLWVNRTSGGSYSATSSITLMEIAS
jgi:hypothetical protein